MEQIFNVLVPCHVHSCSSEYDHGSLQSGKEGGGWGFVGGFQGWIVVVVWFWVFMVLVFLLVIFCDGGGSGG